MLTAIRVFQSVYTFSFKKKPPSVSTLQGIEAEGNLGKLNSDDCDKVTYYETVNSLEEARKIKKLTKKSLEAIELIFSQEGVEKVELLHIGSYIFTCIVYFKDGYTLPEISLAIEPSLIDDERGALLPFYLNQRVQAKKRLDLIGHPVKKEKRVCEKPILKS